MTNPKDLRTDRGTAAQSGAADLALIGAVPAAFGSSPASATLQNIAITKATAGTSPADHKSDAPDAVANVHPLTLSDGLVHQSGALVAPVVIAGTGSASIVMAAAPIDHPQQAQGSGGVYVPAAIEAEPDRLPANHAGDGAVTNAPVAESISPVAAAVPAIGLADPVALETIRMSVATLQEAIGHLTDRLPADAGDHVSDVLAGAQETVAALEGRLGGVAGAIDDQLADAAHAVGALTSAADELAANAGATATHAIGDVAAVANDAVANVGTVTAGVTEAAGESVDHMLAAIPATLDHVVDPLAADAAALAHTVDLSAIPLIGADPAGGITTLVGMVSAADVFQLHDDGAGGAAAMSPALGVLGAVDVLADAHPTDALLGVNDHHDGLLSGSLLGGLGDHHDTLFGHG